jgi:hypothetical protein
METPMAAISWVIALIIAAGIMLVITAFIVNVVRSARTMAPIEKTPPVLTEARKMDILTALTRFKTAGPPAAVTPEKKITDAELMQQVFASASRVACVRGLRGATGGNQPAFDMHTVVIFNGFNDYYDVGYDSEPQPAEDFGKQVADMLGVPFSLE